MASTPLFASSLVRSGARLSAFAMTLAVALVVEPAPAAACGGFFCSASPVDQSGEAIVYAKEPDGTLVMSVRIQYEGDDDAFAWILPVPVAPELSVGTDALFDALKGTTEPTFQWGSHATEGTCLPTPDCYDANTGAECGWAEDEFWADGDSPPPMAGGTADAGLGLDPSVTVYSQGPVGPFETVVLGAATAAEVLGWLGTQGYDLPAAAEEPLEAYAAAGHVFVALKLATDASSRFIQPITMRMSTDEIGCLPLRLTRIAAVPDMPITTYFLGAERVVPSNYSDVRVPIDDLPGLWTGERRWSGEVSSVVDTVGGQGFVTEYAGDTPGIDIALPSVTDLRFERDPAELLRSLQARGFNGTSSMLAALERFLVAPEGQDPQGYYNCLFRASVEACGSPQSFDAAGLIDHLQTSEVEPRNAMQDLVEAHTYLTRMSTAMDPEEMTVDPLFMADGSMPDVSNVHFADRITRCSDEYYQDAAPVDLVIGDTTHRIVEGRPATDRDWCAERWGASCVPEWEAPVRRDRGRCTVANAGGEGSGAFGIGLLLAAFALAARRRR